MEIILSLLLMCIICTNASHKFERNSQRTSKQPNIVFILTDDQDAVLGGMEPMSKTRKHIGEQGAIFTNAFVTSPLCCPSRSSILTGQYVHNHGAVNNSRSGGCSSRSWQQGGEKRAFPSLLQQQGYRTFFAGKYLNQYGRRHAGGVKHVPPGWNEWNGLVGNSRYYNYTLSVNGKAEVHGDNYSTDYLTDVISRKAMSFLKTHTLGKEKQPFFMMLSMPACHAPFTPAPQYQGQFSNRSAPRGGSFGKHGHDKHWLIRVAKNPMSESTVQFIDHTFRNRWRTLLSVDDLVEKVIRYLTKSNILSDTYVIFTSDNGFHQGQFSLPIDKRQMYEFDIRVPFMIRGPGIEPGQVKEEVVLNIDLAPTFVEMSGGRPPPSMNGCSILRLLLPAPPAPPLQDPPPICYPTGQRAFLIEHQGESKGGLSNCPLYINQGVSHCFPDCVCEDALNNTYVCMRGLGGGVNTALCWFIDHESFIEIYDLVSDPHQLTNLAHKLPESLLKRAIHHLKELRTCTDRSCQVSWKIVHRLSTHLKKARRGLLFGQSLKRARYSAGRFEDWLHTD